MNEWFLTSSNVCTGENLKKAWIHIKGGKIQSVEETKPEGYKGHLFDMGSLAILPGLVDSHVHVNEPGRTEWEGFETATHAAAAGGTTTLVDMPLNCIPVTTSREALEIKLENIRDHLWVDVGFWGGAVPENLSTLPDLLEAGVLGVKTFMIDSGIEEFKPLSPLQIDEAMPVLAHYGLAYLFHAELDRGEVKGKPEGPSYDLFLKSRPKSWENGAIEEIISLTRKHKARSHIVHLSSAQALPAIKKAKKEGVTLTVETCPHYLLLSDEQVEAFAFPEQKTLFKCCPPIREESNRQALWQGLKDGTIDMIVSDHSPCTPELKKFSTSDFGQAWGGISSLQYTLSLIWTEGQKQKVSLAQISKWLSESPAQLAGLSGRKGKIEAGYDADLTIFDPDVRWKITSQSTLHRHKLSPYMDKEVQGRVKATYLRGKMIYQDGNFSNMPSGQFLLRGET